MSDKKTKAAEIPEHAAQAVYGPAFQARSMEEWLAINASMGYLPQLTPFSDYSSHMSTAIGMRCRLDAYIAEMHAVNGYSAVMTKMGMGPTGRGS